MDVGAPFKGANSKPSCNMRAGIASGGSLLRGQGRLGLANRRVLTIMTGLF